MLPCKLDSDSDLFLALQAVERLWNARPGSEAAHRLGFVVRLILDYERRTLPPDPYLLALCVS